MIKYFHYDKKVILILLINCLFIFIQYFFIPVDIDKLNFTSMFLGGYFSYLFFFFTIPLISLLQSIITKIFKQNFVLVRSGYKLNELLTISFCFLICIEVIIINLLLVTLITIFKGYPINASAFYYFSYKILLFALTFTSIGQLARLITNNLANSLLLVSVLSIILVIFNLIYIDIKYLEFLSNPNVLQATLIILLLSILLIVYILYPRRDNTNEQTRIY